MVSTSVSLLERLSDSNDARAWGRLTELYSPLIRNWLGRHQVSPSDAEDLVQDVLLIVVRRFPEFEHSRRTGAFRAWLRTITVNCCRDHWRRKRIRPITPGGGDFDGYLDQIADSANPLSKEWDREHDLFITRRLMELIRTDFEANTWEAFRRVTLAGEPASAVAADLGMTANAVFIAKSRVLSRLRQEAAGLVD